MTAGDLRLGLCVGSLKVEEQGSCSEVVGARRNWGIVAEQGYCHRASLALELTLPTSSSSDDHADGTLPKRGIARQVVDAPTSNMFTWKVPETEMTALAAQNWFGNVIFLGLCFLMWVSLRRTPDTHATARPTPGVIVNLRHVQALDTTSSPQLAHCPRSHLVVVAGPGRLLIRELLGSRESLREMSHKKSSRIPLQLGKPGIALRLGIVTVKETCLGISASASGAWLRLAFTSSWSAVSKHKRTKNGGGLLSEQKHATADMETSLSAKPTRKYLLVITASPLVRIVFRGCTGKAVMLVSSCSRSKL